VSRGRFRSVRRAIRWLHVKFASPGVPERVGLYLHELERSDWDSFQEMVEFFRRQDYSFATVEQYLDTDGGRKVLLSFDDNYRSWFEALDLFDQMDVKGIFYVNSLPLLERTIPEELDAYYDRLGFTGDRTPLRVEELREVAARGHTVGCHTHSHPVLADLNFGDACQEIRRSAELLSDVLAQDVRHFAYPYGMRRHFSEDLRQFCRHQRLTVANGIPAMLHVRPIAQAIQRSPWLISESLKYNVANLCVAGHWFAAATGLSAVA